MNLQPLNKHLIVKPEEAKKTTESGIIISQGSSQGSTNRGVIVAIDETEISNLSVGNTVLYNSYSGITLEIDNEKHIILKREELLALIN